MSTSPVRPGTNLCLVIGTLAGPPQLRTLPSGTVVAALEVRVKPAGGSAETVPVAWLDPPASVATWADGLAVVVTGRVRRRFFRAAGSTQSRTEVLAAAVVPTRQRRRATRLVEQLCQAVMAA